MTKMMSVLHVLNELRPSGAEVMIKNAARYWRENGVDLHVLSTGRDVGAYAALLESAGIAVHHISFGRSLRFYAEFLNFVRSHRFAAIHIHTERAALTYTCLARLAGVDRVVRTIHSTFLFEGATKLKAIFRRWAVRHLGVTQVSTSESVHQNEASRFQNPSRLICSWYDEDHFREPSMEERTEARRALGLCETDKTILTVGNCAPVKNHGALIEALVLLRVSGMNPTYWHVGEEDPEGRERGRSQELGLDEQIRFWGRQTDVRPFLWAADVFVMASFNEGLSIAMLEAMACGVRLVLARSPGLIEWQTFFPEIVYADPSPTDLARALTQALDAPHRIELIPRGLLQAKFGVKGGSESYLRLYAE